jgi:hypothetical protein
MAFGGWQRLWLVSLEDGFGDEVEPAGLDSQGFLEPRYSGIRIVHALPRLLVDDSDTFGYFFGYFSCSVSDLSRRELDVGQLLVSKIFGSDFDALCGSIYSVKGPFHCHSFLLGMRQFEESKLSFDYDEMGLSVDS